LCHFWAARHAVLAFTPGIRKMNYTINAANLEAALKLLYPAVKIAGLRWRRGH
jgi:hypothetical protein